MATHARRAPCTPMPHKRLQPASPRSGLRWNRAARTPRVDSRASTPAAGSLEGRAAGARSSRHRVARPRPFQRRRAESRYRPPQLAECRLAAPQALKRDVDEAAAIHRRSSPQRPCSGRHTATVRRRMGAAPSEPKSPLPTAWAQGRPATPRRRAALSEPLGQRSPAHLPGRKLSREALRQALPSLPRLSWASPSQVHYAPGTCATRASSQVSPSPALSASPILRRVSRILRAAGMAGRGRTNSSEGRIRRLGRIR